MSLTPEDVQAKTFKETRFKPGYDEDEVDAFLDEVEAELRRLLADNGDLRSRARVPASAASEPEAEAGLSAENFPQASEAAVPAEAAPVETSSTPAAVAPEPEDEGQQAALRTLLLAQRTADQAVAEARAEAEQLRAESQAQAERSRRDVEEQHAGRVAELTRERGQLEATIEELRAFEREYRSRLTAYLQGQLRDLETRPAADPASTDVPGPADEPPAAEIAGPDTSAFGEPRASAGYSTPASSMGPVGPPRVLGSSANGEPSADETSALGSPGGEAAASAPGEPDDGPDPDRFS